MVNNPYHFSTLGTTVNLPIKDNDDAPHTGLIKALSIYSTGSYPVKTSSDFNITAASASTINITSGRVVRDGELQASVTAGSGLSIGTNTANASYSLVVVDSTNSFAVRATNTDNTVPDMSNGDIPIGMVLYTNSQSTMEFQYFTNRKEKHTLSVAYSNSNSYTEILEMKGNAGNVELTGSALTDISSLDSANDRLLVRDATNNQLKLVAPDDVGGGIDTVVDDTSPQLGGDLDVNSHSIISDSNNENIVIAPHGSGQVVIGNQTETVNRLTSNGARDLKLEANSGVGASITLEDGANGGISITPNGSGEINLGTLPTATVATDDKVVIEDTSDSDDLKTVTAQSIADLYDEEDTLADVTSRGATTTTALTLGAVTADKVTVDGFKNEGETEIIPIDPNTANTDLGSVGFDDTVYYIDTTLSLADGTNGQIIHIKNVAATQSIINTSQPIDGSGAATDQRRTGPNQITLETMEGITLQYVNDVASVSIGWYILDTDVDTDTGIENVVEDTSPQLGGNLDTNGKYIDFDDAFGIRDSNSNEQLIFQETGSATNYFEITNADSGNDPSYLRLVAIPMWVLKLKLKEMEKLLLMEM